MALSPPHPGKEAKRYQVEETRELLERVGVQRMNTRFHNRYTARIEYDERDNIFVGHILGIRSIICFHRETVTKLRSQFENGVEEYLTDCKKEGVQPERPESGKLLLRVPPEVHGRPLVAAQAAGKSMNRCATEVLEHAVQPGG